MNAAWLTSTGAQTVTLLTVGPLSIPVGANVSRVYGTCYLLTNSRDANEPKFTSGPGSGTHAPRACTLPHSALGSRDFFTATKGRKAFGGSSVCGAQSRTKLLGLLLFFRAGHKACSPPGLQGETPSVGTAGPHVTGTGRKQLPR